MNVGACIRVGRYNPEANGMICPVRQGHWTFDELVWLEGEAELQRVNVQQLANLSGSEGEYLRASKR